MDNFQKEVALRKILSDEEKRISSNRKDRVYFLLCATCLAAVAVLPKGIHNFPLTFTALVSWFLYVEAFEVPKNWSNNSDIRSHFFRGHKILENAFKKDKGWKTLILMMGFVLLKIIVRMK